MSALFIASYAVLWVVVLALSVMILLLYRHFGLMAMSTAEGHERDGLALGSKASALSGVDARNVQHEWTPPLGNHSLLVFASPGCEPCEQIAPFLGQLGRSSAELLNRVVVVATGRDDAALALEKATGGGALCLADNASGAAELYQNPGHPVRVRDQPGRHGRRQGPAVQPRLPSKPARPFGFVRGREGTRWAGRASPRRSAPAPVRAVDAQSEELNQ